MENIFTAVPALQQWVSPESLGSMARVCKAWKSFTQEPKQLRKLLAWRFPGMEYILEETPEDWLPRHFVKSLEMGLLDEIVEYKLPPPRRGTHRLLTRRWSYFDDTGVGPGNVDMLKREFLSHGYTPVLENEEAVSFQVMPFVYFFDQYMQFASFEDFPNRAQIFWQDFARWNRRALCTQGISLGDGACSTAVDRSIVKKEELSKPLTSTDTK